MQNIKIGIMGAGNMAGAIAKGIISGSVVNAADITISDIDADKLNKFKNDGINTTLDNEALFKSSDYIILAVKPQIAKKVLASLKVAAQGKKIISIMAGITKSMIKEMLGNDIKVARIMPNTPCLLGMGMCAVDASDFDNSGKILVMDIFGSLGKVIDLPEKFFHAVTAVSGSGPAYVYMFIDAMIKGGIKAGLSEATAKTLALQTFRGSTAMVEECSDIGQLIKNVCSPGGTTIQAVNYYNENSLEDTIMEGIDLCEKRSRELSENV